MYPFGSRGTYLFHMNRPCKFVVYPKTKVFVARHILQYSALKKYRHGHSWTISFGYQHGYRFLNAHLYKPLLGPFLDYQEVIINIIHGRNDVALLNNSE